MSRYVHVTCVVSAVLLAFVLFTPAEGREPGSEQFARPLSWVYDAGSRKTHRLADLRGVFRRFFRNFPLGYWPHQVRRAYGFDRLSNDGAGQVIAIPNAFHYPTAAADLKKFIQTFKLKGMYGLPGTAPCTVAAGPHPCFQLVYARGTEPDYDSLWSLESALDIQWAHAIAPGADILLVEGASNNLADLFQAVNVATNMGASVVSMSWGAPEFPIQSVFDPLLDIDGVTFVAGSGDSGNGALFPGVSSRVVAVGGTRLPLNFWGNRTLAETAWSGSGGGITMLVTEPQYQSDYPIPDTLGKRGAPDVAYNADPDTGFAIYVTPGVANNTYGWLEIGGTSAGSPQWAALIALANELRGTNLSSNDLVASPLYDAAIDDYVANYRDIKSGTNGTCGTVCRAALNYDFVTGLGSPRADSLVEYLAGY